MAVRLRDERSYPASPARVFALLADPAYQERRSRHFGTLEAHASSVQEGGAIVLALEEARDTGWPPHVFESRHTTRWDPATFRGDWELVQTGGPGHARACGTIVIAPSGSGALVTVEGLLIIRVPLFARIIEHLARRAITAHRDREAGFLAHALSDDGFGMLTD